MLARRIFNRSKVHSMIYKKHILTKSDFSSYIHVRYIQLAKESIEYKVVSRHCKKIDVQKNNDY